MICSVRFYRLDSPRIDPFIAALRDGGLYRELVRQLQPGHIACDLLQSITCPDEFMSIDFWTTARAYAVAKYAPPTVTLDRFLSNLALNVDDRGPFTFASPRNPSCEPSTPGGRDLAGLPGREQRCREDELPSRIHESWSSANSSTGSGHASCPLISACDGKRQPERQPARVIRCFLCL